MGIGNLVCKTAGILGMSTVLYDAYTVAQRYSIVGAEEASSDTFERITAAKRTTTNESTVMSSMQNKVAELRSSNPIVPIYGHIKGFIKGALNSLGDNIIPATLSAIALAGKGFWQKFGAWGLGIYGALMIAKEGFGIGKRTPMDK